MLMIERYDGCLIAGIACSISVMEADDHMLTFNWLRCVSAGLVICLLIDGQFHVLIALEFDSMIFFFLHRAVSFILTWLESTDSKTLLPTQLNEPMCLRV